MKFVCAQSDLNFHLSLVGRAVPSRPSKPILGNILIQADLEAQQVTLTGFDETLGIETTFGAAVEAPGVLTLPAKLLENIVSRLPAEDIAVEQVEAEATLSLTCSSGEYEVRGLSAEEYPTLPALDQGRGAQISADALLEGLRGSLFASSVDETKQVLTGVHLLAAEDVLEFAATDGHRLAVVKTMDQKDKVNAADSPQDSLSLDVTVPGKSLRELERMLQSYASSEPVALQLDRTQVIFELGQQRLTTRLLEGQYPNYPQLIPRQFSHQATVDRKALTSALERIAVLADQEKNIVKLSLNPEEGLLSVSVEALEVGSGREVVPAQISGEGLEIAFNVRYLLDGLKALGTTEIQMQCNSPTTPSVLIPLGSVQMTYLVMPVQIRS